MLSSVSASVAFELIVHDLDGEPGQEKITIQNGIIKVEHLETSKYPDYYSIGGTIDEESFQVFDIDYSGGAELIGVSDSGSYNEDLFIIDNTADTFSRYYIDGDIISSSLKITNLDSRGDLEIIGLTSVGSENKLFIISNDTSVLPSKHWTSNFAIPANISDIDTNYDWENPKATSNIAIHNFDASYKTIIVPGIDELNLLTYGPDSIIRKRQLNATPEEYMIINLDGRNEKEIVALYEDYMGERSLFVYNPITEQFKRFSFWNGIFSPHLVYIPTPNNNHYVTNDVVITNMIDGTYYGLEIVGLFLDNSDQLGLFSISYPDSNGNNTDEWKTIGFGGFYLGLNNLKEDARYVIGNIKNVGAGLDIYGYYGGSEVKGAFLLSDYFSNIEYFSISYSGSVDSMSEFFDLSSPYIEDNSLFLIDPDNDSYVNGKDDCPTTEGYEDPDNDGVCAPLDECPNETNLTSKTSCGTCIYDDLDCDGYSGAEDACPNDPTDHIDSDDDGVCDTQDECPQSNGWVDADGDGTCAPLDQCDSDTSKTLAGVCGCGNPEPVADFNGDGQITIADCSVSSCPGDPEKLDDPGICGCGVPDIDSDGDGMPDCLDECSFDPSKTVAGECGCYNADVDQDGNGTIDCLAPSDSAKVTYYHSDLVGTPEAITDNTGTPIWKASYMPFGEEYEYAGATYNDRRFIAKEKDIETGLSYFGARYMDVDFGRFLAADPVRIVNAGSGQVNSAILLDPQRIGLYGYGLNNPYRYVDPDGRAPHQWADGNYSDNDGQAHPGWSAQVNKAYSQVGQGIAEGWQYHPAIIVGTGLGGSGLSLAKLTVKSFPKVAGKISQKQLRHILGRMEYRGGGYLNSVDDAQKVLKAFNSGKTKILGKSKQGFPVVKYGGVTGTNVNRGAGISSQSTNVFMIKGTKKPSVVPMNPKWK